MSILRYASNVCFIYRGWVNSQRSATLTELELDLQWAVEWCPRELKSHGTLLRFTYSVNVHTAPSPTSRHCSSPRYMSRLDRTIPAVIVSLGDFADTGKIVKMDVSEE